MIVLDPKTMAALGWNLPNYLAETGERFLGGVRAEDKVVLFFERAGESYAVIFQVLDSGDLVDVTEVAMNEGIAELAAEATECGKGRTLQ